MTKEDPDQLINVGPYLVPIGQLMERSGWSYQETLDYAAIATAMHEARVAGVSEAEIAHCLSLA
jgi:hypothetical protein